MGPLKVGQGIDQQLGIVQDSIVALDDRSEDIGEGPALGFPLAEPVQGSGPNDGSRTTLVL